MDSSFKLEPFLNVATLLFTAGLLISDTGTNMLISLVCIIIIIIIHLFWGAPFITPTDTLQGIGAIYGTLKTVDFAGVRQDKQQEMDYRRPQKDTRGFSIL